jgi:polyferredoxin
VDYKKLRYVILGLFLILFSFITIKHYVFGGENSGSVDAFCAFGGIETFFTLLNTGHFIPRILSSSLILGIAVLITIIFFRKGFCGWICPFGAVQEFLGKLNSKKLIIKKKHLKLDQYGKYIKYIILIWILLGTAITGTLVYRGYDPFMTFFHFGKGVLWAIESAEEFKLHLLSFLLTIGVLIGAVYIDRFFCRYLCPLGATMNIFTKLGLTKITRNKKNCNGCKKCDEVCPMDIKVHGVDYVNDVECINCNLCVNVCPKKSLSIKIFDKIISPMKYVLMLVVLFFLIIGVSKAFGLWQSVPQIIDLGDSYETFNSESISGWMTLDQVATMAGMNSDTLIDELRLVGVNPSTPLNEIKEIVPNYHTQQVRDFFKDYNPNLASEIKVDAVKEVACPFGIHDDSYPGMCGLYRDLDNNNLCDLSE